MDEHQGSAPCIPVWKTGVYLSTLMLGEWNPVLESHQPLRLCRPPPELLGQRDTTKAVPKAENRWPVNTRDDELPAKSDGLVFALFPH